MGIEAIRYKHRKESGIVAVTVRMTKEEREVLNKAVHQSQQTQNAFILDALDYYVKLQQDQHDDGQSIT
jgi:hypothetical protein